MNFATSTLLVYLGSAGLEPTVISQKIYSLPRCHLRSWTQKKYKRNRENFYWALHFSYLHKYTLTLFQFIIIDNLPFNSLQVPEFDFL